MSIRRRRLPPSRLLAVYNREQKTLMAKRGRRRAQRFAKGEPIAFLDPESTIARTQIKVRDARVGNFDGAEIPHDLQRQWIQGTGPAPSPTRH